MDKGKEIINMTTKEKIKNLIINEISIYTVEEVMRLVDQIREETINDFYHRFDCNCLISEMYGWRTVLDMTKEELLSQLKKGDK